MTTIRWRMGEHGRLPRKGDVGEAQRRFADACRIWNDALVGLVRFEPTPSANIVPDLVWRFGTDAISAAERRQGRIAEHNLRPGGVSLIEFDARERWFTSVRPSWWERSFREDFLSMAVHELGHVLRIDHTEDLPGWIMHEWVEPLRDRTRLPAVEALFYRDQVRRKMEEAPAA